MSQSKNRTAEQCLICTENGKKKPKHGFLFWFSVVRFSVNLCALIDKHGLKILSFFGFGME